jgi:dTDP-4-amino-4,6-dideoxygalactose transaminase
MQYNIPLFKLNFDEQEEKAVIETIRSRWISTGPKCEELEKTFSSMMGAEYSVSLSNCTSALHLALIALGIGNGDEVICPSLTFVATVNSIRYVNAIPVFCDIKSLEHPNIDAGKIESLITPKTKAIVVVHLAGFPCEMDEIVSLAKKYNLKVIEDACHAPLSEYNGKKLGSIGDVGCFSFFSNKNISTGEGGMIITDNEEVFKRVKLLRSHGMTTLSYERSLGHAVVYDVVDLGYNFRMDDIRASIAIVQLKKLKDDLIKRAEIRKKYIELLSEIDDVLIPFRDVNSFTSNYIMPIVLKNATAERRMLVREFLHKNGIQTSLHYPPVHKFSMYKECKVLLPITDKFVDTEITLPMYSSLSTEEIQYICDNIKDALIEAK